jgi:uncharacterized delta-60 repeat protein
MKRYVGGLIKALGRSCFSGDFLRRSAARPLGMRLVREGIRRVPLRPQLEVLETRDLPSAGLDPGFGFWGETFATFGKAANATAVAIQPSDNKIVVAGSTTSSDGGVDFALARYLPNGALDTSFNYDGKVMTSFFGGKSSAFAEAVAIQYDGKIVVAGYTTHGLGRNNGDSNLIALARYLPTGNLDPSFGHDPTRPGMVLSWFQDSWGTQVDSVALAMVLQTEGFGVEKIVVGGIADGSFGALARFNPDGSRDWSFGSAVTQGETLSSLSNSVYGITALTALTIDSHNGDIVAAGSTGIADLSPYKLAVALYHADGTPDTSFGIQGSAVLAQPSMGDAVAVDNSDNIVVAGGIWKGPHEQFLLARYLPSGNLDANFHGDGLVVTDFGHNANVGALFIQDDNIIAVGGGGAFGPGFGFDLAAYLPNGDPDVSFAPGGTLSQFPDSCRAYGATMQADNDIVVVGSLPSQLGFLVVRYVTGYPVDQVQIDGGINGNPVSGGYVADLLIDSRGTSQRLKNLALQHPVAAAKPSFDPHLGLHGTQELALSSCRHGTTKLAKSVHPANDLVFSCFEAPELAA